MEVWSGGASSVAYLTTTGGNDTFIGSSVYSQTTGTTGYSNYAIGFANVVATAGSTNSSVDLYDSPGNDTFQGSGWSARLTGLGYSVQATGFGQVRLHKTQGGTDHSSATSVNYVFTEFGNWL